MTENTLADQNQIRRIADLCDESYVARKLMDWLGTSTEPPKFNYTTIKSAANAVGREYKEVMEAFKRLEKISVGGIVPGRHGYPTRFIWFRSYLPLQAALKIERDKRASEETEDVGSENALSTASVDMLQHPYMLRRDMPVEFELPADFTAKEAERLANWIRTLPFD